MKSIATKVQKAIDKINEGKNITVVDAARGYDKHYKESGVEQKVGEVPPGLSRVDIDVRPVGRLNAIYKNYDYATNGDVHQVSPGLSFYRRMDEVDSVKEFVEKERKVEQDKSTADDSLTYGNYNDRKKVDNSINASIKKRVINRRKNQIKNLCNEK